MIHGEIMGHTFGLPLFLPVVEKWVNRRCDPKKAPAGNPPALH
jgi:hypothetical protein